MKRAALIFRFRLRHLASRRVDAMPLVLDLPRFFLRRTKTKYLQFRRPETCTGNIKLNFAAEALVAEAEELKSLNPCNSNMLINNPWREATFKGRVSKTRFNKI